MADDPDLYVEDFDHPHADLTNDLLPPHPADGDNAGRSMSARARLQALANTIAIERRPVAGLDGYRPSANRARTGGAPTAATRRPPTPPLASQRRMRFVLSQLGEDQDDTQTSNGMDDRTAAARARQRRRVRATDNRANDTSQTSSDFRNRRLQSPPFERTLQGNVDLLRRTSEDLRHRSEQLRTLLDLPIEDEASDMLDDQLRREGTDRSASRSLLPFLENRRPGNEVVENMSSDILRLRAASLRHLLDRGMADQVQAALPRPVRPYRSDSQSQDQGRRKRRRVDDGRAQKRYERITYGVEGTVVPGKLKMDILSCDGEECGIQYGYDNRTYGVENILKDDDSVYCPTSQRANIVLTHFGQTTFHLEKLVIKTPQKGYTNTLQEGLVFASLVKDEAFDRTASYSIFSYQDTHFAAMEKIAPDGRRYDPTAAGRQNHPALVTRWQPFLDTEPELQDRGMTWMGPSHQNTYPSRFDIHDPGLCSELYYDPGIDNAEKAFLSNGPHTVVRHTSDGTPTPADSESDVSLQELNRVANEAGLGRYMTPPGATTDVPSNYQEELQRRSSGPENGDRERRHREGRSIYARMANRVRRHMAGRGTASHVDFQPPPPPPPPPPYMPPWPRTNLASDDHSDTDADEHTYSGFPSYTPDSAMHSVTPPPPPPPPPPPVETSFERSTSHMHTDKLTTEAPAHLAPNARFIMAKSTAKNKLVVEFDPPLAAKYLLLKLWSPSRGGTIDVQSVECFGYAGMRFFPSVETV